MGRNVLLDFAAATALTWEPVTLADPTYAERNVTINPGQDWQTVIDGQSAGTESNPIIFGITAGTHVRADTLGAVPKDHHWFVGESDGVPTSVFPNGTPTSKVDGTRTSAPGTDTFLKSVSGGPSGVKVVMLEIDGFAPTTDHHVSGGVGTVDWYWSHVNQHHCSESGIRMGQGTLMRYCWVHHNGRQGLSSNVAQPGGARLEGVVVEDTTVEYNNQLEYAPNVAGSAAGGSKFIGTNSMTIQRCDFSRNGGPGIWFDGGSTGMQILNNTCWDNVLASQGGEGIFLEILDCTTGALIDGNDCRRNGGAANFYNSNSQGASGSPIVYSNNYAEEHPQWEIMVYNNGSRSPNADWVEVTDNEFKRTVASGNASRRLSGVRVDNGGEAASTLNILYDRNTYTWDPTNLEHSTPFQVDLSANTWAAWQALGYDPNSSYVEV